MKIFKFPTQEINNNKKKLLQDFFSFYYGIYKRQDFQSIFITLFHVNEIREPNKN